VTLGRAVEWSVILWNGSWRSDSRKRIQGQCCDDETTKQESLQTNTIRYVVEKIQPEEEEESKDGNSEGNNQVIFSRRLGRLDWNSVLQGGTIDRDRLQRERLPQTSESVPFRGRYVKDGRA
jgi:hypothetical protein